MNKKNAKGKMLKAKTSRELEVEQLKLALARTEQALIDAQENLYRLADKKARQRAELLLQETMAAVERRNR
jgi:hypothetical protein